MTASKRITSAPPCAIKPDRPGECDHTLVQYFLLAAQRSRRRLPWLRRHLLVVTALCAFAGLYSFAILPSLLRPANPIASNGIDIYAAGVFTIAVPTFLVWLALGVFNAARESLAFLGGSRWRGAGLKLDPCLAATPVSSQVLLRAVLTATLPPLVGLVVLGAIGFLIANYLMISTTMMHPIPRPDLAERAVLWAGANFLLMLAWGVLAMLLCTFSWVAWGRGARDAIYPSVAAMVMAVVQVAWIPATLGLAQILAQILDYITPSSIGVKLPYQEDIVFVRTCFAVGLIGMSALLSAALYLSIRAVVRWPMVGLVAAIALPLLGLGCGSVWWRVFAFRGFQPDWAWLTGGILPFGLPALVNPLATGSGGLIETCGYAQYAPGPGGGYWLMGTLAYQALLAFILWRAALSVIDRTRRDMLPS